MLLQLLTLYWKRHSRVCLIETAVQQLFLVESGRTLMKANDNGGLLMPDAMGMVLLRGPKAAFHRLDRAYRKQTFYRLISILSARDRQHRVSRRSES